MADVFVSYDRRDRDLAEKVVGALTEQGLTVWWDDRITPHETWDKTIEREVDSARRVLVLWTNHSVQSDWVRTEAGAAKESTPPKLIQARFADCKVPLAFRLLQHVDLIGWPPKKKHAGWDRLVGWLKAEDGPTAAPALVATPKPASVAPEPVTAQAPVGLAAMGAAAPAAPTEAVPTQAVTPPPVAAADAAPKSTPAAAPSPSVPPAAGSGVSTKTGPDNKKVLMIAGGVIGGLILIAILMSVFSNMGGGGSAGGVSQAEQQTVSGYLANYQGRYAQGAVAVGGDEFAALANGGTHEWTVRLESGRDYRILGACDTNCRNVDLELLGPDGNVVTSDVLPDDFPVVGFRPNQTTEFTARLTMANCTADRCVVGGRLTTAQ